jgi:hypothetical protein
MPDGQVAQISSHATDRAGQAYSFAEGHTGAALDPSEPPEGPA